MSDKQKIVNVYLDERSVVRRSASVEHERKVAIYDLLEKNRFAPSDTPDGPYNLHLGIEENRLVFDVRDENDAELTRFTLPLSPLRLIVRNYFLICDSYYKSIQTASPSRIEAIDMGRRGLHNEGAEVLRERLADKADIDHNTARHMFTLICVLHIRA
ncbi:MAG TPA: UPF0262 family protein [Rhodospirillales bacterium]|nr:UPF0262 family protein [Rhodospirillales bacterium]